MTTTFVVLMSALCQAPSAKPAQISAPAQIAALDAGRLKGEPTQLAWSADGTKLFLQTSERDGKGMIKSPRFYVMSASAGRPEPVDAPPPWAVEYWAWKSNKFAPGSTTFGIEVKQEDRQVAATAAPMGGDLARGGSGDAAGAGTSAGDVAARVGQTQMQRVFSLTARGETVGEFVNQQFLPGYTFGWSPRQQGMVAYANQAGRLAILDEHGQKTQVDDTRNVILPAWSPDGSRIAYLQRSGKNKYDLFIANVNR
ncbi:MAG: hypothetical protein ABIQ52_02485 [Vicinamibacterales bacterium]